MEGDIVVTLTGMDRSGAATARLGGERLVVPGGIPGERVRLRRLRPLAGGVLAEIVEVEEASPNRVTPRCRHATDCGGCAWQHVAYPEQLRRKSAALGALLRRAMGERAPRVLPAIGLPAGGDGMPWGFRQKAAFVCGEGPRGLVVGHFARGTHDVVPIEECPVHDERANRIAFALRDALAAAGIRAAGAGGLARHVVVRTSRDGAEAVAMLVVARDDVALDVPLLPLLEGPERVDGVVLNIHDRAGPFLVGRESRRVGGRGHVEERSLGPAFLVSPASFFQTSVAAAATLLRLVAEALPGESGLRVLDLYSGGGLFSVPLALRGHHVTAVEQSRKAVRDAALNRRRNGIGEDRLRLVSAPVELAVRRFAPGAFDAVVLDPPRDGCPPAVVSDVFGRLRPARAVLVSCNPEALARELPLADGLGYRALRVQPLDMFPHTPHVEAVAVLERRDDGQGGAANRLRRRTPSSRSRTPGSRTPPAPDRSRTAGSRRRAGGGRT